MIITKRLRHEKDIIVRIKRSLAGKGKLNVLKGREVIPDEVIGTSVVSSGFRIINVAHLLNIEPGSIERYLQRAVGQKIYKGELLAYKPGGLLQKKGVVTAPTDGVIDFINPATGEVKMSFLPRKVDLPAAVYGIVEFVDDSRGQVLIKTQMTKIHGIFGTGRQRDGILHLSDVKSGLIDAGNISLKYAGGILVGRGLIYKDAISAAISAGVSGIITGGISSKDYKGMAGGRLIFPKKFDNDIGIAIVVCEGFGSVQIGWDILDLLSRHDGKFVFIDGNRAEVGLPEFTSDCMRRIRSVQLPPLPQDGPKVTEANWEDLQVGACVRIAGMTYLGDQGRIVRIDGSKTRLGSGILAQLVTIETKTRKVQVPVANIEII